MDEDPSTWHVAAPSSDPFAGMSQKERKRALRQRRKISPRLCVVYGLTDAAGRIRYIGQTRQTLRARLGYHFKDAKSGNSPLHKWIRQTPGVEIVCLDSNATWDVSEILVIDRFVREGHELLNVLRGGSDTLKDVRRQSGYPNKAYAKQSRPQLPPYPT